MRFYCAKHSSGTLCGRCAEHKAHDEEVQRIYKDYLNMAENIKRPGLGTYLVWTLLGALGTVVVWVVIWGMGVLLILAQVVQPETLNEWTSSDAGGWVLLFVSVISFATIMGVGITQLERKAYLEVRRINTLRPGFAQFYELWRQQKDKETLLTAVALGMAAVAAAAGVYQAHQRQQLYRDVHDIKEKL